MSEVDNNHVDNDFLFICRYPENEARRTSILNANETPFDFEILILSERMGERERLNRGSRTQYPPLRTIEETSMTREPGQSSNNIIISRTIFNIY